MMAPLPKPFDARVHWIRDALHRGDRQRALKLIDEAVASGKAGAETLALADYLRTAKRGRQPFGAKHRWPDIGADNEELRDAGIGYEERRERLGQKYMLDVTQIATAIARYERAMDEVRAIDREKQD